MTHDKMVQGITNIILQRNYTKGFVVAHPRGGRGSGIAYSWHWSINGASRKAESHGGSVIYELRTGKVYQTVSVLETVGRIVPTVKFERFRPGSAVAGLG